MKSWDISGLTECIVSERIKLDEPMSKHTSFRIGGPADVWIEPTGEELPKILSYCKEKNIPLSVIGNGSNILVGDAGIRGVVLCVGQGMKGIKIEGTRITAKAGELLSSVASEACENGLGGMEFASGIPGSLGGAVIMNAGAYDGQMKDILISATYVNEEGKEVKVSAKELELSYRHSALMDRQVIITEVELCLHEADSNDIRSRMKELSLKRIEKQPLEFPSAGSTFKRPKGHFAGKLIMDAGLAGFRVGGAVVSPKHCGFVINEGNATANDVKTLMDVVTDKVKVEFGVCLEPEVRFVGDFN